MSESQANNERSNEINQRKSCGLWKEAMSSMNESHAVNERKSWKQPMESSKQCTIFPFNLHPLQVPYFTLIYPDYFPSQRNFVSQSGKKFFPVREKILPNWGQKRGLPEPSSNYCQSIKSIQIELFENDGSIIVFVTPYYLYKGLLLLYIKTSLLIVSRLCLCLMAKLP